MRALVELLVVIVGAYIAHSLHNAWVRFRRARWPKEAEEMRELIAPDGTSKVTITTRANIEMLRRGVIGMGKRLSDLEDRIDRLEHDAMAREKGR